MAEKIKKRLPSKSIYKTDKAIEHFKIKEEYIANAIHKLRTPLAIIKGNVDLSLKEEELSSTMRITLKHINKEVVDLSDLLYDLAFLTRKDANFDKPLVITKIFLYKVIERVVNRFWPLLHNKKIKVKIEKGPKKFIQGDELYLEKLFTNIIGNAVAYSQPCSKIIITFIENLTQITIKIKDTGIGIAKDDIEHIFERFYRGKKPKNIRDNHTGMGLGLAVARGIALSHGGNVSVESIVGEGSTFIISLPLPKGKK